VSAGHPERVTPRATYRLQLTPSFGFADAAALVPQLAELGVSHLYLSPSLEAVPGSQHGYDVTDPTRIRAALGGEDGLRALHATAADAGLGLVLDIVPNHVGLVSPANPWWWDVLAHGPEGRYGHHLDVRWVPGEHGQPTLLLPELGASLDEELAGTDLQLAHGDEPVGAAPPGWRVVYHEHVWPVRPGSLEAVGLDPDAVDDTLAAVAGDREKLRELLAHQHYRLAVWTRANDELDHRRFFAVSTLGGVRIEDPDVFEEAHAAVLPLVADGVLDGIRIDHPDGLRDPAAYLHRLRERAGERPWIVVEKILERGEPYRTDWPIDGTVGYEFADLLLKLQVDADGVEVFDVLQAHLTGKALDRAGLADASQRFVLRTMFGTELRHTTRRLVDASGLDPEVADRTLVELLVAWPVYRTYVRPDAGEVAAEDRAVVDHAVAHVRAHAPDLGDALDAVRDLLLLEAGDDPARATFVWAFQQLTGPAMAKGVEDTVLYRDLRFTAVNEVGSDPGHLDVSPGDVHAAHLRAQRERPATMLLSSTHDTKRSADVRARLAVLSQDPDHWVRTVRRWRELAAPHRGATGPAPAHEHLVLQTLVGAWPITRERLHAYLEKAVREGAETTDHLAPDTAYEADLTAYVDGLLDDEAFVADLERVVAEVREPGWLTSLAMVLVKLTAPGVPDVYQGDELWDLSLVDPDNRRPVDHDRRRTLLAELRDPPDPAALLARLDEGVPKLWLVRQALALRAQRPDAFGRTTTYTPVWAAGRRSDQVLAFVRGDEVLAVAPQRVRQLGPTFATWDWRGTALPVPAGRWRDVLTGAEVTGGTDVAVADLLHGFPVALLAREG
jgi:(1->4)-alpha-D-glucan 1-alpha-D-glucosylmutase